MKKFYLSLIILVSLIFCFSCAEAYVFNGTTYSDNGTILASTLVNVSVYDQSMNFNSSNSSTTNASGWFNFSIPGNTTCLYLVKVTHTTGSTVDYVGQSMPMLPYSETMLLSGIRFNMKNAGTLNITAINSSNTAVPFNYYVKDNKLGFPVAELFDSYVTQVVLYVPVDRNYTIFIFPNQSLPVFFEWNNFSSTSNYNLNTYSPSNYTVNTKTLTKVFNTTSSSVRVTGYVNRSGNDTAPWNNLTIVPYVLEPGNRIYFGDGDMPYNMSAFFYDGAQGDSYNVSVGFYNISLPAPVETANYLLFAAARNGSNYYGGFANLTASLGDASKKLNISTYGLLGEVSNITMNNANSWSAVGITTSLLTFRLNNASNVSLSSLSAFIETQVDYSSYGSILFTMATDIDQNAAASFSLPLLNVTGIKEMNAYTQQYAPRRLTFTLATLRANTTNITMRAFNPGDIDGAIDSDLITMNLYYSNSTCDVPYPPASCLIGGSESLEDFNPMKSVMGGGKISFRMGSGNISVHYVNVDMIASGPPDALFDDSTTNASVGDSFSAALRFGSGGPTIYDYVFVGFPYSDLAGGLDEDHSVNISLPILYDDSWNVIWNTTVNGSTGSALAATYPHYLTYQTAWQQLMGNNVCGTDQTAISSTSPCYINVTTNTIWIRLPHFSGTGPSVSAASEAAATRSSSSSSSSASEGKLSESEDNETVKVVKKEIVGGEIESVPPVSLDSFSGWDEGSVAFDIEEGEMFEFDFVNSSGITEKHIITIMEVNAEEASITILIESNPQEVKLFLGTSRQVDLDDDGVYDIEFILEDMTSDGIAQIAINKIGTWEVAIEEESRTYLWITVLVVLLLLVVIIFVNFAYRKKRQLKRKK